MTARGESTTEAAEDGPAPDAPTKGSGALLAIALIGIGLVLAPIVFQMFTRAPGGGEMLDEFEQYMDIGEIDEFRTHLDTIEAARDDSATAPAAAGLPAVEELRERWSAIDDDMGEMLDSMEANLSEYRGVKALPPFVLFPWFFVIPGVLLAGVVVLAVRNTIDRRRGATFLLTIGIGLIAAPAVFQMWTRAPGGARMIDDFKPMMTDERVRSVQGYFLTIGSAEGEMRRELLPATETGDLPAIETFVENWPAMSADMAPMIGTMSDNVGNFAGVAALPPFWLFPIFFVVPGALVVGLAAADRRSPQPQAPRPQASEAQGADA